MSRFGYLRDRLFLISVTAYALNRWLLKPLFPSPFLHGYFSDMLMIPAALPSALWAQRLTGLRLHDLAPSWSEIVFHLAIWTVICEYVGPIWMHRGTADWWDVAAYAFGGILSFLWWNRSR
jgi:hypothetical protein